MLKLLFYVILFYLGYRLFLKPLFDPPQQELPRREDPDRIADKGTKFGNEEGEYIDYEEID